jgi:hypothetical protein
MNLQQGQSVTLSDNSNVDETYFKIGVSNLNFIFQMYRRDMTHSGAFIMRESKISQRIPSKGNRLLVFKLDESNPYLSVLKDFNSRCITLEMKNENGVIEKFNPTGNSDYTVRYNKQRNAYQFSNAIIFLEIPKLSESEIDEHYFELDFYQETVMEYDLGKIALDTSLLDKKKPVDILIRNNKIVGLKQGSKLVKTSLSGNFNADIILRSYNFLGAYITVTLNYDNEFWLSSECLIGHIYEHLEVIERRVLL